MSGKSSSIGTIVGATVGSVAGGLLLGNPYLGMAVGAGLGGGIGGKQDQKRLERQQRYTPTDVNKPKSYDSRIDEAMNRRKNNVNRSVM